MLPAMQVAVEGRVLLLSEQVQTGRRETPKGLGGVKNEPCISRTPLCPINSTGVRTPPPLVRRTGNMHVARVMNMSRRIFSLPTTDPRQQLDKLT